MRKRFKIIIGARDSKLSRAQVDEVIAGMGSDFSFRFFQTKGDKDLVTSLRTLPPGNFFTKELDEALLEGTIDLAIHSAKDLPPRMPEGLELIALTQGKTAQDALVIRKGTSIQELPSGARIATSSRRREEAVQKLCPTATFIDIRGTVDSRLEKLIQGHIDGLVVAACALYRLGVTEFPTYLLEGPTARFQGRLALVARKNDDRLTTLFAPIDTKKTLFFGIEPKEGATHVPLIQTIARPIEAHFASIERSDLFIFTSKASVDHFVKQVPPSLLAIVRKKRIIAIGEKTAFRLHLNGFLHIETPKEETSEGIVAHLKSISLERVFVFYPHSARSRDVIRCFLEENKVSFADVILYDTHFLPPSIAVDPNDFDELYFSSPSTFDAFLHFFHQIPESIFIKTEGSVTRKHIENYLGDSYDVHLTSVTI